MMNEMQCFWSLSLYYLGQKTLFEEAFNTHHMRLPPKGDVSHKYFAKHCDSRTKNQSKVARK